MSFSHLGLSDKVLGAIEAAGYKTPTPIQEQAIPHVLARRDVLGIAQTGTGKTAAFVLPMLTMLEQGRARVDENRRVSERVTEGARHPPVGPGMPGAFGGRVSRRSCSRTRRPARRPCGRGTGSGPTGRA